MTIRTLVMIMAIAATIVALICGIVGFELGRAPPIIVIHETAPTSISHDQR